MGTEPASDLGARSTADGDRVIRLRSVWDVVRLYERLEHALGQTSDGDLERLAAASRAGERALGDWARRIESLRVFKRRFEAGALAQSPLLASAPPRRFLAPPWTLPEPRAMPFMWEAVAFAVGFGVSLLWDALASPLFR